MKPEQLIGMPYRLGANPIKHGAADCLSLACTVLNYYGIPTPEPKRSWYKRLKRGEYSVFEEELSRWGEKTADLKCGVVALCRADNGGFGLAVYWSDGWLNFAGSEVRWSPSVVLQVVECYCPSRQTSATSLT